MVKEYDIVKVDFPFISANNSGRGVDRYCYMLSEGYKSLGLNFLNINGSQFGTYFNSHYLPLPRKLFETLKTHAKLFHSTTPVAWMLPYLAKKKKIITTIHDLVPFYDGKTRIGVTKKFNNYVLINQIIGSIHKSDKIITPFKTTKQWLLDHFDLEDSKVIVINYGIDQDWINSHFNKDLVLARKRDFLFIGSGNPLDRGSEYALNAFKLFMGQNYGERLVISMKSGVVQSQKTLKLIKDLALDKSVKVIDFIPEDSLLQVISRFRALVYPSRLGFSLLLMESLAAGTPIIAGDALDVPEFLEGSSINPVKFNYYSIFEEMVKLMSESYLICTIKKGIEHISKFNSNKMVNQTLKAYNTLIDL